MMRRLSNRCQVGREMRDAAPSRRASGRLDDLNSLQSTRYHQIAQASLRLLQCETDATTGASEPGRRNRGADSNVSRGEELVNIVLRPERGRRQRSELEGRIDRVGMHTVKRPDPIDGKLRW